MGVQTSVEFQPTVGIPGGVHGSDPMTRNRTAQVAIQAGLFVVQGTEGKVKLPTTSAEVGKGLGIAPSRVHDSVFPSGGTPGVTYQIGDTVGAVYRGTVWVTVEEAVGPMDPVYVRYDTGTGSQKGAFRKSADTSTAALLAGARYLTGALANGLALVDINIP